MRSYKLYLTLAMAIVLLFSVSAVCASDIDNTILNTDNSSSLTSGDSVDVISESSEEITVNDWDDLQLYCSKSDKNYVLKLKENTNYYPSDVEDESYQIQVNNNVTIIGSSGAYIGDSSPNARSINYLAINVPENSGNGITLKGITFKWIASEYQPNAIFLLMAGNTSNVIENCVFTNITMTGGHSSVIQMLRGDVTLTNCSFTNITSDFGCLSLYDPKDDPTKTCTHARAEVDNCYFEGNYARTEPGCINNCGVLVVRNSTFYRNTAFWWAGAIHTHGGANTTIYDSNFTDNLAGWNGGALYTYSYLQIYNTIFVGNNCTTNNGCGAIGACKYLHAPYIYVVDSLFEDNENLCWALTDESPGLGRGGAISIMDEGGLTVLNTTFISNSASIGTAICAITQGSNYGSPDVTIVGNRFINHTRVSDVLVIKLDYDSSCNISDNYYLGNSIEFSKLKLVADDRVGDEVELHIDAALKNSNYYDSDILDKSDYLVYVDGVYLKTITGLDFTLNLKNIEKAQVYVVPSISTSKSNEVSVGMPKEYIYVSQKSGDNNNDGSKNSPVATLDRAIELANATGNIMILDGTFSQTDLEINYDLSITGEDNVIITSTGNIFNVGNVEFTIKNITFKNSKQSSSASERIIKQSGGLLVIEDCVFDSNSYNTLIESAAPIEAKNLKFTNNNGILIAADDFKIISSIFDSNTAATKSRMPTLIKSNAAEKSVISDSIFSNNNVLDGCVYYNTKVGLNTLTVTGSIFENNVASDGCSGIVMSYSGILDVKSSLFLNNTDSGKTGAVILTSTEVHVADSIFLANSIANSNNAIINAKSSVNLKKIYCDGNWFGNTQEDYDVVPQISSSSNCNYWLFLNASANTTSMFIGESAIVDFNLNNVYNKNGNVTYWDSSNLPTVKLDISTNGGVSSDSELTLVYGMGKLTYTLQKTEGSLIASYNGLKDIINFTEAKVKPEMTVTLSNISVDDDEVINIELPADATGSLTVTVGNITQSQNIANPKITFTLSDLVAGDYAAVVTYSGDDYYSAVEKTLKFKVNKYNSTTSITVGQIDVGQDVTLTINVSPSVTGNITLIINNKEETLPLVNSKATYTINAITRGDYDVKAVYNGDYKYLTSEDSLKFSVDKLDTELSVNVDDIVYGQDAKIDIILDSAAGGSVIVSVNGVNTTSEVKDGKASVIVSNLNAGDKQVLVYYSGDNVFNPITKNASFSVSKANTALTINVNDVMIGHDVTIEVLVEGGVDGNITIICNNQNITKSIPRTGKVSWKLSDLKVGEYEVAASLSSNNYFNVDNSTTFKVSDYNAPQWSNEGYDIQNTGKSPYDVSSNGAVIWCFNASGDVASNMAIDYDGNVYFITSNGVYAINKNGQLWNYNSNMGGNLSGLAISRDVVAVPEEGNTIHFINITTGEKFGNSNIYWASSLFAPIVDSNANIYISSEYQYASNDYKLVVIPYSIWENGGNPTLISLGNSKPVSAPVIVNENTAVVACSDSLKIIDLDKKEVISSIRGANNGIRPVIGPENMIYSVLDDSVVAITPNAVQIWKTKITSVAGKYLALDDEWGVYSINSNGNLCRYDLVDGSESVISNLTFTSGILVGNDGNIYVGSNSMLYAFDSEGNVLWKSDLGSEITGTPIVDKDGLIYVSTKESVVALTSAPLQTPNIKIDVNDSVFGKTVTVAVEIDNQCTGDLIIKIDDEIYTEAIIDQGAVIKAVSNLSVGIHTVEVSFNGDARFSFKSVSSNFTVNKAKTSLNITSEDINVGEDLIITVQMPEDVNGKVSAEINGKSYSAIVKNGKANMTISDLNAGNYSLTVKFTGDEYEDCENVTEFKVLKVEVPSADDTIDLNVSDSGEASDYSISLPDDATGTLTVTVDGVDYTATLVNGKATVNVPELSEGSHNITVTYSGDAKYSPIVKNTTVNVAKKPVINITAKDLAILYTSGKSYQIVLTKDGKGFASQTVTITINGKKYTRTTNANGYASVKISLPPKTYTVTAVYGDLKVSKKLTVKSIVVAKNVNAKRSAKTIKIKVTLSKVNGKYLKSKKVTLKFNKKTFSVKTNKKGVATFTIKNSVYKKLKTGKKYTYQVTYGKNTVKKTIKFKK